MGSLLKKMKLQQVYRSGVATSVNEYDDLFTVMTSFVQSKWNKPLARSRIDMFTMIEKRLIGSVILCLALLRIARWKGLIGHPRDRDKYYLNSRMSSFQPREFDVATSDEEGTFCATTFKI